MQSTNKKVRASSNKHESYIAREGIDEELRRYFMEIRGTDERRNRMQWDVSIEDIPLEERRREAKKALYLVRYE